MLFAVLQESCSIPDGIYLYHAIENTANQKTGKLLNTHVMHAMEKYGQSEYRIAFENSTVEHPSFPSSTALIVLATVFFMASYKIVMQHFFVVYHGISHESLAFSLICITRKLNASNFDIPCY